jgi:hypothetical protein
MQTGLVTVVAGSDNRGVTVDIAADLAHYPAVAFAMLFAIAGGLFMVIINLRNARLWLLRITGRRAQGVVNTIELVSDSDGSVLRRPIVTFTTSAGYQIVGSPVVYRKSVSLTRGAAVTVSYAAHNPTRMVVHGFDIRYQEMVYACLGAVIAVGISMWYFKIP